MEGVAVAVAVAALIVAGVAIGLLLRSQRQGAQLSPDAARTANLERRMAQVAQRLEVLEADVDAQRGGPDDARTPIDAVPRGTAAISRIGLVRFDAFEDTGGAQSFALALVDDHGDGIVLSSLHSRPTTRVYIKAIRRGVADAPLSAEEEEALREAGITP